MKNYLISLIVIIHLIIIFTLNISFTYASSIWSITTKLPYKLASHSSINHSNFIYIINGSADFRSSKYTVLKNTANSTGNLYNWQLNTTNTQKALIWHTSTKYKNYVYILGGKDENSGTTIHLNSVFFGKIINDNIINWDLTSSLPQSLSLGNSLNIKNYLYYFGGLIENNGNIYNNKIFYSLINEEDGALNVWEEAGLLKEPLSGFGVINEGNNVTVIGGENLNGKKKEVYYTSINDNGTISDWKATSSLPKPLSRFAYTRVGSKVFVIGGINTDGTTSDLVYYADIKNDGSLDKWQTSSVKIPQPTCCATAESINGFIYLLGGHNTNDGSYFDNVYYAKAEDLVTSNKITLDVPLFKQGISPYNNTDPIWENDIFDHATTQFSCGNKMWQCGCSTTSMAMLLKYHGINYLPDGTEIDPGTLNTWLKNTPGGYLRDSGINWAVAATLGVKAKSQNTEFDFKALEYTRSNTNDVEVLKQDLEDGNPAIINVPGHFIVGTGIDGENYSINDPFYNRTHLDSYNNTFLSLRRFSPHNSDNSYIVLAIDKEVNIQVKKPNGEFLPDAVIQEQVNNPTENNSDINSVLKVIEYPKPEDGLYKILITSDKVKEYQLDIYLISKNGDVQTDSIKGIVSKNIEEFDVNYSKTDENKITKNVTFKTLIDDIKEGEKLKQISKSVSSNLISIAKNAETDFKKKKYKTSILKLETIKLTINTIKKQTMKQQLVDILIYDLNYLIEFMKLY